MKKQINHNFDITFVPAELFHEVGRDRVKTKIPNPYRLRTPTPVMALDHFHRMMQRELHQGHRFYSVKKLEKVYNDGSGNNGREIRSEFDLPDTRTPDVTKKKRHRVETLCMPFYDEAQDAVDMAEGAFVDSK